jgi:hypothetical protein
LRTNRKRVAAIQNRDSPPKSRSEKAATPRASDRPKRPRVTDAVGGRSQIAHRTGIERLAHAGAVPTTALAVTTELFRDWATPAIDPALEVIYWYFTEVPKLTAAVGVADAEKQAAAAQVGAK